jgi:hypothetical protein
MQVEVEVRAVVDEAQRVVHLIVPPLAKLTEHESRAVLERARALRREWEAKGYAVHY